jgi:hypothetical protein
VGTYSAASSWVPIVRSSLGAAAHRLHADHTPWRAGDGWLMKGRRGSGRFAVTSC